MTEDYSNLVDDKALELIGKVFGSTDLQQPAVIMTALVSMLGSLLAVKAIEDGLEEETLDAEVKALLGDIRHKTTAMHRLLRDKLKQCQDQDKDPSRTTH